MVGRMDAAVRLSGPLEPRDGWEAERCSVAAALGVVHNTSAFLVLRELFYGAERFDEIARRARLSEPTVAARLRELTTEGLLEREDYKEPGQRTRQKYRLTEKGADFFPILASLMQWGDRWVNHGGPIELRHRDCGEPVAVELRCAAGHVVERSGDLDVTLRRA
jgi:DNA-binding HxlR family transcriptional regulator